MNARRRTKVVFRTDASLEIGTGHVMRCLTLADALSAEGSECHFMCRENPGHMLDFIRQRGHTAHGLKTDECSAKAAHDNGFLNSHESWLGCDWLTDAKQASTVLDLLKPDWCVIDHYALDSRWESAIGEYCDKVMVIDDLADRPHDCNLLLDQTLGRLSRDYEDLVSAGAAILAGPNYALLRPEFSALREYSLARRNTPDLKRILITMGGVDKFNATGQVLNVLKTWSFIGTCRITIVMGAHAPWLENVREQALGLPCPSEVLVNTSDMAQLMADSDLAIGAAGSTSWERCCLGVPTITLVLAQNQIEAARRLEEAGAAIVLHTCSDLGVTLGGALARISSPLLMKRMSEKARAVTDGAGVSRVVHNMLAISQGRISCE